MVDPLSYFSFLPVHYFCINLMNSTCMCRHVCVRVHMCVCACVRACLRVKIFFLVNGRCIFLHVLITIKKLLFFYNTAPVASYNKHT